MQHIYRKQTSHVLAHRPVPLHTQVSLPDHLQVFQWNASRSLDSAIWIHWCDSSPYDLIIIQESGWSMINEWNNAHWHIVHTADRYILILFMVCSAVIKSRWPYTYRAECCRYAWLCLDPTTLLSSINRRGRPNMVSGRSCPSVSMCGINYVNILNISPNDT